MDNTPPIPDWFAELDEGDREFVRRFLLSSGSLKELADLYGVSYPTIRLRLDRLLVRVKAVEQAKELDPFERKIRVMVADGTITSAIARQLLAAYHANSKRKDHK